ncbi:MAG TPA: hypothetical protein VFQ90_09620 [Stellaceae bacterium]|nr:hypothetical protein [Stellaceae bacterium]
MRSGFLAASILLLSVDPAMAQSNNGSSINQGPGSALSFGQQGGITAGTVNIAPGRVPFTMELGNQLLEHMPDKNKVVRLMTVGGNADQNIGNEVQQFLQHSGYSVQRMSIGMMAPPPDHPFIFNESSDQYIITVAPSAH